MTRRGLSSFGWIVAEFFALDWLKLVIVYRGNGYVVAIEVIIVFIATEFGSFEGQF